MIHFFRASSNFWCKKVLACQSDDFSQLLMRSTPIALLFSHQGRKSISYCFGFVPISDFYDNYARRRRDQIWLFAQCALARSLSPPVCACTKTNCDLQFIILQRTGERALECARIAQESHYGRYIYVRAIGGGPSPFSSKSTHKCTHILSHLCPARRRYAREQARP
jgi:hypothetical protein